MNTIETLLNLLADASSSFNSDEHISQLKALQILEAASEITKLNVVSVEAVYAIEEFLRITSQPEFLKSLKDYNHRNNWAEICFDFIQKSNFNLLSLFRQRVNEHPTKILFQEYKQQNPIRITYKSADNMIREIAGGFISVCENIEPRVAILCDNSTESAMCDLACLFYSILDTPLNVSFDTDTLISIFNDLKINLVVTDSLERLNMLKFLRNKTNRDFKIIVTMRNLPTDNDSVLFLGELQKSLTIAERETILNTHRKFKLNEVATVMFTSGSTGKPKGISFSIYNLISKRFARGAAVPYLGDNEVMLCYLPLFHTFGRYLELLGTIYWRGTYIFTGNSSSDTLLTLFTKINPTIFISVPIRWVQLYEKALESMENVTDSETMDRIYRNTVGSRLKWGLSAAGYLDPKVFQFFQRNGTDLCSGFGMTEGTGGITMTPPGNYVLGSTGIPLPGIKTKFSDDGVMEISGHYVAKYFDDAKPGDIIEFPHEKENWISTGDIFSINDNGFYEIIDRVKDIYKNNRGQTIAPKKIENKFESVPGIKRTFLVGDGKPYNTLLIIPDMNDNILMEKSLKTKNEYYRQIILNANRELAPYERLINFTVLERDFDAEKGELTPKQSFNRKNIEKNFSDVIENLYIKNFVELKDENITVKIPRWIFRDLSILESDISFINGFLINNNSGCKINIRKIDTDENRYLIGNLEYEINDKVIDIGIFTRQPFLWAANPELARFLHLKDGWDTNFEKISINVFLPWKYKSISGSKFKYEISGLKAIQLNEINNLLSQALFGDVISSKDALYSLENLLPKVEERIADLIRRRLQTLARHPEEDIRCEAYRILLLDEPSRDYSKVFPAFVHSGLTYLNERTINRIAKGKLEIRRLEALRKRLYSYRVSADLPKSENNTKQFDNLFRLLFNFVKINPEYYTYARYEFISWMLYKKDDSLKQLAEQYFNELHKYYEKKLEVETPKFTIEAWRKKLMYDDDIEQSEIDNLEHILVNTAFIKQSVILAYDEFDYSLADVPEGGIWISRLDSTPDVYRYRVSIYTKAKKKFDLQLFAFLNNSFKDNLETVLWHVAISGHPHGYRVVPNLGAYRPELNALSYEYFGELTLWGKIREIASRRVSGKSYDKFESIKKLFIMSMAVFFKGWHNSGRAIVPGLVSTTNVIVPELDFREGTIINSINGFCYYDSPMSIMNPIVRNFYERTIAHYSWLKNQLKVEWIFDSCIEGLGYESGFEYLNELTKTEGMDILFINNQNLLEALLQYLDSLKSSYHPPLAISNAIDRYDEWFEQNKNALAIAKDQIIDELMRLYTISRFGEIARYYLYRHTYFQNHGSAINEKLDLIIHKLNSNPEEQANQLIELSEIQSLLNSSDDKILFRKLIFPQVEIRSHLQVIIKDEQNTSRLIFQTFIKDAFSEMYAFREPAKLSEIGELYRLFFKEKYPKEISENDEYFVLLDYQERIVGGICYKLSDNHSVLVDGIVVSSAVKNRGLGSNMIEDFCHRMANKGIKVIKTHYFLQNFYQKIGFHVNDRFGALVRFLETNTESLAKEDKI